MRNNSGGLCGWGSERQRGRARSWDYGITSILSCRWRGWSADACLHRARYYYWLKPVASSKVPRAPPTALVSLDRLKPALGEKRWRARNHEDPEAVSRDSKEKQVIS